ncbi:hypothetical protein ABEB36_012343 [Hypothenemus hampei]|uniref:Uncharacterized protein n=1 Tax=Hypothenemus hampei TaxID=57062 RepID=A0ABD1EAV6_HYPHA
MSVRVFKCAEMLNLVVGVALLNNYSTHKFAFNFVAQCMSFQKMTKCANKKHYSDKQIIPNL